MAVWWKRWGWLAVLAACGVAAFVPVLCIDEAESDHLPVQQGQCDRLDWDHNWDCVVNSNDLWIVAMHFGEKAATWTPSPAATSAPPTTISSSTSTPTPTATATSTTVASATPTATPTATNTLIETILRDSDGRCRKADGQVRQCYENGVNSGTPLSPHDVRPCVPDGYDWAWAARVQGVGPAGYNSIDGWGVIQHPGCNASAAGSTVYVRNFQTWVYNGQWHNVKNGSTWCGVFDQTTAFPQGGGCSASGPWVMPAQPVSIHFAAGRAALPAGTQCGLVLLEARYTGVVAPMIDAGLDWKPLTSDGIRAGGVGRYGRLMTDWTWHGFSTCPEAVVRGFAP